MEPTDGDTDSTPTDSDPTDGEQACFEAGIKFGTLYHQFAGTPVSPDSAPSLERAIEESIENQPFCESVSVDILTEKLAEEIDHVPASGSEGERGEGSLAEGEEASSGGYTELTGRFMEVEIVVDREGREVVTRMEMEDGYPLMKVESVTET
ncbi:dihydroneopterin aldolase family protein [Halorussus pelagicus]|uniref:dihydroneopterin aldolase family protein n=1 Tax=Halorussus pelagicus TaxID=2505977 RepID=UPI000FFCBD02|nr:dihydroneopterin aldolase family protein [Halorussus pelagicus]